MAKPNNDQLHAVTELYKVAQGDHGGSNVSARLLLGLYNGARFPFDLTDLRRLDLRNFENALQVLTMDYQPHLEVHALLATLHGVPTVRMNYEFESWAHKWRLKGRCKKDELDHLKVRAFAKAIA
jgi:hypothetical protein